VEDKANGPAVISFLSNSIPGLIPITPRGTKVARAYGVSPFFQSGNVWVPPLSVPWVSDYVSEITQFPSAENDDQVDATTQALDRFFSRKKLETLGAKLPDLTQANPWGEM
jgi:predicted phage terminase large subunit-like protein